MPPNKLRKSAVVSVMHYQLMSIMALHHAALHLVSIGDSVMSTQSASLFDVVSGSHSGFLVHVLAGAHCGSVECSIRFD